ncbi:MAG: LCP family protein [Actinomycetes bacterium]
MSAPAPDPSRRRWPRVLLITVGAVAGVLALAAASVAVLLENLEGNVEREQVFEAVPEVDRPSPEPTRALDVLVLGSDTRDDELGTAWSGPDAEEGERADTTLLVRLTADRTGAWVVSIPRDSWVRLPSCTARDGSRLPARDGQFNSAYRDGGVPCAVRAVESLTGVRIDHTVVVEFSGFADMVDALDGVPVCIEEPFQPREVDLELPPGRHVLGPRDALDYVRARYGVDDGSDLSRIERQKQFMASMVERALSRGVLLRPDRLVRFASAVTESLRVDEDLDVRELAMSLRGLERDRIVFSTVPLDPAPGPEFAEGGRLYGRVAWDEPAAARLFEALKEDRLPVDEPAPTGTPTDAPPPPAGDDTTAPQQPPPTPADAASELACA